MSDTQIILYLCGFCVTCVLLFNDPKKPTVDDDTAPFYGVYVLIAMILWPAYWVVSGIYFLSKGKK